MKALPTPAQVSATQIIMRLQAGESFRDALARVLIRAHVAPNVAAVALEYARERGVIGEASE